MVKFMKEVELNHFPMKSKLIKFNIRFQLYDAAIVCAGEGAKPSFTTLKGMKCVIQVELVGIPWNTWDSDPSVNSKQYSLKSSERQCVRHHPFGNYQYA